MSRLEYLAPIVRPQIEVFNGQVTRHELDLILDPSQSAKASEAASKPSGAELDIMSPTFRPADVSKEATFHLGGLTIVLTENERFDLAAPSAQSSITRIATISPQPIVTSSSAAVRPVFEYWTTEHGDQRGASRDVEAYILVGDKVWPTTKFEPPQLSGLKNSLELTPEGSVYMKSIGELADELEYLYTVAQTREERALSPFRQVHFERVMPWLAQLGSENRIPNKSLE